MGIHPKRCQNSTEGVWYQVEKTDVKVPQRLTVEHSTFPLPMRSRKISCRSQCGLDANNFSYASKMKLVANGENATESSQVEWKWISRARKSAFVLQISYFWWEQELPIRLFGLRGKPGILPKTPFLVVPVYLGDIPPTFEHSRPHFLRHHGKRSKKQEGHGWRIMTENMNTEFLVDLSEGEGIK